MISVIIATFNRSQRLRRVLASFFQQNALDLLNYELLIVDNNSSDDTRVVAEEFLHSQKVRYILESKQGVSAARNRGVYESNGERVAFLDDDVEVDKNWLRNLELCFQETGADVVGGRSYLVFEEEPPEWFGPCFRTCLSEVDLGDARKVISSDSHLFGLNLAIRKEVFALQGGFDESLGRIGHELSGGEETALVGKIISDGKTIIYDPEVIVRHVIEANRLRWNYFTALAVARGRTSEQREFSCNLLYQLLRIGKALCLWIQSVCISAHASLFRRSNYEQKQAEFDFIASRSHLWHRLRRVWR